MSKPIILIAGGTGFIGRHLVQYIVENELAAKVRVLDKKMPVLVNLTPEQKKFFDSDVVEFVQADLKKPDHLDRAFKGLEEGKVDYFVNLAGETCFGQDKKIYEDQIYDLGLGIAKAAAKNKVGKYVEMSTAQVYKPGKKARKENYKTLSPWTGIAKEKYRLEKELSKIEGLNYIILRPSIVYGVGDMYGLSPRIIVAATYAYTKKKMKLLWTGDLKINCVHVKDVAKVTWHVLENGTKGQVFNVSDKSNLSQKKFNAILQEIFKIKTGFAGTIFSNLAKLKLKEIVQDANDGHMDPWNDMKKESKIRRSPLSPFIDIELLSNNNFCIDGSLIESTGFKYDYPQIKTQYIQEVIKAYQDLKLFPVLN